jgi:cytochrome c peroxidase
MRNLLFGLVCALPLLAGDAVVALGRQLFFDVRLSSDGKVACASCHQPGHGFADPRAVSAGVDGQRGTRNAPTVLNKDKQRRFFWDGRAGSLEEQAAGPLLNPLEMGNTREGLEKRLNGMPEYGAKFRAAFGEGAITLERVTQAIAAYERSLVRRDSAFDRWSQGDKNALTAEQERGRELFFGRANCSQCHAGRDFTNGDFVNISAGKENPPDEGRRAVTWAARDWRLFQVPSLREVARTAPYMHDGSLKTLEEVVDFYDRGGEVVENKDYRILPLNLKAEEKKALVAFLHALTSTAGTEEAPPEAGVARSACFPVEKLGAEDRAKAEKLFLALLDSEGLYAVAGVKPMSSGYVGFRLAAENPDAGELEDARRLLGYFQCGEDVFATVQHFARTYENPQTKVRERAYEGVVFSRAALRRAVERHSGFFQGLGLGPWSHPMEILMSVEYSEMGPRWRGLGYLYGYPDYAVDFFVEAGLSQQRDGKFVERDFFGVATFARAERGVVYAVAKGAARRPEDDAFRARLLEVLAQYRSRREKYIGEGKAGVVALLRDWFCGDGEVCAAPAAR